MAKPRSIPARTGEPSRSPPPSRSSAVYPRAYGGTAADLSLQLLSEGLSPRVRGNLSSLESMPTRNGSIPARTGEP